MTRSAQTSRSLSASRAVTRPSSNNGRSGSRLKGNGRRIVTNSPSSTQTERRRRTMHPTIRRSHSGGGLTPQHHGSHSHMQVTVQRHHRRDPSDSSVSSSVLTGREGREPYGPKGPSYRDSSPARSSSSRSGRSRTDKHLSAKRAIEDLNKNVHDDKRLSKLTTACSEFDHYDEAKHNMELQYGAASVLARTMTATDDEDEIRMICSALEMVFRASLASVQTAFDKVGSAVTPWLLQILLECETGRMKNPDTSILNITKTLTYFSRVPDLRFVLAQHTGMLDALRRISTSMLSVEARVARMRLISNLANCDQNKLAIVNHEGLLESILRIAALDISESAREYASTVLSDLASCPENQIAMGKDEKLLGTLVKLAVVESMAEAREAAITALQNLAYCQENRKRLALFGSGVVLEALKKTISTDSNEKARRRAAGALTNLVCQETAERMGNHKGLLEALAVVSSRDENQEVQSRATMALSKLAACITKAMDCYRNLLDALVVASLSKQGSSSISTVLRVKAREPENRESMARHPGILDTLSDVCVSPHFPVKVRDNAMRAIMHLTNEDSNRVIMCNRTMLDALLACANSDDEKNPEINESAMVALERLATDSSNRPTMARHPGLLVTVAKATERETKIQDATKDGEARDFLAKPLLMSLLLAI